MDVLPKTPLATALSCAALWTVVRLLQMIIKGRKYGAHEYILVSEDAIWRNFFPSGTNIPGIIYGKNRPFHAKYSEFQRAGKDAYMQVAMTHTRPAIYVADPQAIKTMTLQKTRYMKDVVTFAGAIGMYGPNMASVEGEDWKRHRKANQRAFNEKNIQLVWSETEDIMRRLFDIWDQTGEDEIRVGSVPDMTEKLALLVIAMAAFGRRLSWKSEDDVVPEGRKMSFPQSLRTVSSSLTTRMIIPKWAENMTEKTREVTTAFAEFGIYLKEMIAARRKGTETDGPSLGDTPHAQFASDSLFNMLIAANDPDTPGEKMLADEDVTGNAFFFLFAGHESTAHTIAFALGLLALHADVQQEVHEQIKEAMGSRHKIEYSDMNDINLVAAVFSETLRMYPVVDQFPKIAVEDSVISVARNGPGMDENTREDFFIPKGANIWFSIVAAHYNPTYWPEPEKFRPRRFLEPYNKDAFLAFSVGPRSCLGRTFAETEGIVAIASILARYEIKIDEQLFPTIPGESLLEREARLLQPAHGITLSPAKLPLVFKRR